MSNYFKENIYYIRRKNKLTQEQFGKKLGKAISTISSWEKGDRSPIVSDVVLIGNAFGYNPADLLFSNLSETEYNKEADELCNLYFSLSKEQKQAVLTLMKSMKGT